MSERCPATEAPRSTTISRRTLVRGVAWATPAITIVSSAPAIAASPCDPVTYTVPFNNDATYTRTSSTQGRGTTIPVAGAAPVTFTVGATGRGNKELVAALNLLRSNHPNSNGGSNLGGLGVAGLQLQQSGGRGGYESGQSVTFTFSRPVTGLRFYVVDIDRSGTSNTAGIYQDAVALSGSPTIDQRAPNVVGAATLADPLHRTLNGELNSSDSGGNARVTYPGTISSFTLDFWSMTGWAAQQIFVTQMTFTAAGCA